MSTLPSKAMRSSSPTRSRAPSVGEPRRTRDSARRSCRTGTTSGSTSSRHAPSSTTRRARYHWSSGLGFAKTCSAVTSRSTRWRHRSATEDFGRLVDPYGGRTDLDARLLRVLHNLSFIDDPTRIFRGIRYEARHGFRFEDHSARLLRGCIEMGLVGDLSSGRLRDELVALLKDPGCCARNPQARRARRRPRDPCAPPRRRRGRSALLTRVCASRRDRGSTCPSWRLGLAALARGHDLRRSVRLARPTHDSPSRQRPNRRGCDRGTADPQASPLRAAQESRRRS